MNLAKPPTKTENSKTTEQKLENQNGLRPGDTKQPTGPTRDFESPQTGSESPQTGSESPQTDNNLNQVPEQPCRAPAIEMSGEMQESGFEHRQWLVQRDGQFVQLPEVLYHILEEANGRQNLEQIANAVSEKMNRKLNLNQLQRLIANKLIPRGLIVKKDGTVEKVGGQSGRAATHSPLAVNMKMLTISPRLIEPVTKILQYLYMPPVLIALLVATVIVQGWLFVLHGVAQSTRELLYQPGFMLIMLAIIIATAAFHEFGHASALRYGGGKVRKMGVGIYLIYPAFYTDVSDNYRLSRWPRVRTDLGGFYFNLIFSLVIMSLYALTGQEFLLLAVLLSDIEILHQLLPFVRLDGYWTLADVTGIPDFFSKMGPFLRTVLPLSFWKGPKLPNLKGWVKAVFALYILVTIPLLTFVLFVMIQSLPRILATAWDSFTIQLSEFSKAWKGGDILAMAGTLGQMVLLALPVIGLIYVFYTLGRKAVTALWKWSKPTPARRVMGSLIGVGVVAFLVFLWAPQLPFTNNKPGPAYAYLQKNFIPVGPSERGTIGDAFSAIFKPAGANEFMPTPSNNASPGPQPTAPGFVPPVNPEPTLIPGPTPGLATPAPQPTPPVANTVPPPPLPTPTPAILPQVPLPVGPVKSIVAPVAPVVSPVVATVAPVVSPVAPIATTAGNVVATAVPVVTTVAATAAPVLTAAPLPITPPQAGNLLPLPPTPTPKK